MVPRWGSCTLANHDIEMQYDSQSTIIMRDSDHKSLGYVLVFASNTVRPDFRVYATLIKRACSRDRHWL